MSISCISLRLKGKWSIRQKHRFHSTPSVLFPLCRYSANSLIGILFHSYFFYQWGRKYKKGSQSLCFWRLMPKGEKILSPKQKDRTTTNFKIFNLVYIQRFFNWYLNLFHIGKTLLNTKRRISFRGSFV